MFALKNLRVAVPAAAVIGGTTFASVVSAKEPDYNAVQKDILEIFDEDNSRGPLFVRLSWHASGTYDKNTGSGGSYGATMRFSPEADHGANAGLGLARDLLEKVKQKHPEISYADLWTLAGTTVVEEMGGPKVGFRPGRKDAATGAECTPDGRLPDADKGSQTATAKHIREDVFYRMGFDDEGIVCLSGAHALGRCHTDRSGYWGPWTRAETTFSNEYFRLLLEEKWTLKEKHEGVSWCGPPQYEDPTGELMMLPSDLMLVQDPKFRPHVEKYAKDEDLFFKDFAKYFQRLNELGSGLPKTGPRRYWFFGPREY